MGQIIQYGAAPIVRSGPGCIIPILIVVALIAGSVWAAGAIDKQVATQEVITGLVVKPGISVSYGNVGHLVGGGPVVVQASPDEEMYIAKTWETGGVRYYQVPRTVPPSLSIMNTEEAQEYIIRRLVSCRCDFDTSLEVLDSGLIAAMASDNIQRSMPPSGVFNWADYKELAMAALENDKASMKTILGIVTVMSGGHASGLVGLGLLVATGVVVGLLLSRRGQPQVGHPMYNQMQYPYHDNFPAPQDYMMLPSGVQFLGYDNRNRPIYVDTNGRRVRINVHHR